MKFFFIIGIVTWHLAIFAKAKHDVVPSSNGGTTRANTDIKTDNAENIRYHDLENEDPMHLEQLAVDIVTRGERNFSTNFFKMTSQDRLGNYVCSPLSIYIILSMASYGSKGTSRTQLFNVLGIPMFKNQHHIDEGYRTLLFGLEFQSNVHLRTKNKFLYGPNNNSPLGEYTKTIKNVFGNTYDVLDSDRFEYKPKSINERNAKIVEDASDTNIIANTDLSLHPVVILASSFELKGAWETQFNPVNTRRKLFMHSESYSTEISTMYAYDYFPFGELPEVDATFIETPFKSHNSGDALSMFWILPNKIDGLKSLKKNIDKSILDHLCDNSSPVMTKVHAFLPKFSIKNTVYIQNDLEKMGLTDIFTSTSDFSGISENPVITSRGASHYAMIDVHEYGIGPVTKSENEQDDRRRIFPSHIEQQDTVIFDANHPFILIIAARGYLRANLLMAQFVGLEEKDINLNRL